MADAQDNPQDAAPVTDATTAPTEPKNAPKDAPKDAAPPTVLDGGDDDTTGDVPKGDWPEDWRDKMAAGDEKLLARLKRFQSPLNVLKSWRALEQRVSSGELKAAKPTEMSEEDHAKWRADNGIPEKPEGYLEKLSLPDGLQIGEQDKPFVDKVLAAAHNSDVSPEAVSGMIGAYYEVQDELVAQRAEKDREDRSVNEEALRAEWGSEYKGNIAALEQFLDTGPEGAKELLIHARLGDGTGLMNHTEIFKWLVGLARDANPVPTLTTRGGDPMQGIEEEIASIEKKMGTREYIKDEKMQERYRQLVDAREKLKSKAA